MTGTLRGALTSEEIKKYVKHCLKPGKASGPDNCPNELLKTMTEEEFVIVQEWVNEILTLPAKTDHTENGRKRATMNGTISQLHKGSSTNKPCDQRPVVLLNSIPTAQLHHQRAVEKNCGAGEPAATGARWKQARPMCKNQHAATAFHHT